MESFNYSNPFNKNMITHVIHMDSYKEHLKSMKSPLLNVGGNIYDEFHTYGVLWTDKDYGVSHSQQCLLLTCEVPGLGIDHTGKMLDPATGKYKTHWTGNVEKNSKKKNYEFVVDYVKVFQN